MEFGRGRLALVAATLSVGMFADGCGPAENGVSTALDGDSSPEGPSGSPHQPPASESLVPEPGPQRSILVPDGQAPVVGDLERLAESFVEYAVGESNTFPHVVCAPTRTGPVPSGRLVVIRPVQEWRTCAGDFALARAADEQGRLRSIDLTLSEP
jgi:hypothetical protein